MYAERLQRDESTQSVSISELIFYQNGITTSSGYAAGIQYISSLLQSPETFALTIRAIGPNIPIEVLNNWEMRFVSINSDTLQRFDRVDTSIKEVLDKVTAISDRLITIETELAIIKNRRNWIYKIATILLLAGNLILGFTKSAG